VKALVTGAGGYIGSGLVETLQGDGWEVRALVRHEAPHLAVEQFVAPLDQGSDAVAEAFRGVDTVVHLAGENEVVAARAPAESLASTVLATEHVVEKAAAEGVKRLIYMSTVHVYGQRMTDGATLSEELRPEPRATYAISRLASEHVAASLADGGADVVVLRLTNSVGAPAVPEIDRWTLVTNDLCRQGATTGRLELRTPGLQWRDFVPLRDVRAAIAAASRAEDPVLPTGTYNLASGRPMTVRQLAELVQDVFERATGERPELRAPEPGPERPEPYHVSIERAAQYGLRSETPIEDAVDETVRFCIEHREALK
jgi:UDP-glucose 4-epimerase